MTALSRADAVDLLGFVADAQAVRGPDPFTTELLDRFAVVMGCAFATYQRVDLKRRVVYHEVICSNEARHPARPESGSRGELREGAVYVRLAPGEVRAWSDDFDRSTRRRYEAIPWARPFEIVDCAAICIGSSSDRALLILHSQERDFTGRDRRKLCALHPHVHALIRDARARKRLASLTRTIEA